MSDSKIMSDSHWLGRIRGLMQQVGMPDSQSLYLAFTQLMFDMQRAALAAAPHAAQEPAERNLLACAICGADRLTESCRAERPMACPFVGKT